MKKSIQLFTFITISVIFLTQCKNETKSGFADINGTKIYYEITGEGTPLIFHHGWTCDHRNWNPQIEYFVNKYKVITYDARGHGKSNVPDTIPYSYEEDLAALMDYLNIEKAVIIGHSLGGAPAFFYSLHHPERVLGLVLAEGGAVLGDPAIVDTSSIPGYINEFSKAITVAQNEGLEEGKKALG